MSYTLENALDEAKQFGEAVGRITAYRSTLLWINSIDGFETKLHMARLGALLEKKIEFEMIAMKDAAK